MHHQLSLLQGLLILVPYILLGYALQEEHCIQTFLILLELFLSNILNYFQLTLAALTYICLINSKNLGECTAIN